MVLSEHGLSCFRTKACNNYANGQCQFTESKCIYSHNEICIRRCPYYLSDISYIRYIPMFCKNVVLGPDFKVVECKCSHGNECIYSHCLDELLYHPQFYKVQECKEFTQGNCTRAFCPFYHSQEEKRTLKHYKLPFCKGIKIPPIKFITMVDKIGKVKPDAESLVKRRRKRKVHAQTQDPCGGDNGHGIISSQNGNTLPQFDDINDVALDLRNAQERINAQIDAVGDVSSSGILQGLFAVDSGCSSPIPNSLMASPLVNKSKLIHEMYNCNLPQLNLDDYNDIGDDDVDTLPYITRSSTIERDFVQMSSHLEEFTNETKQTLYRNIKGLLESPKMLPFEWDVSIFGSSPPVHEDAHLSLLKNYKGQIPQDLLHQYNAILQHNNYYTDGYEYEYN